MDFAFLIIASISASSFRRGVISEPRNLNLLVNWTLAPSDRTISSGSSVCNLASFKDAGKNIASDFDLGERDPRHIVSPKHEKCLFRTLIVTCSLLLF
jgi:hypothetical protein